MAVLIPRTGQPADPHPLILAALSVTALGLAWLLLRHREAFLIPRRR